MARVTALPRVHLRLPANGPILCRLPRCLLPLSDLATSHLFGLHLHFLCHHLPRCSQTYVPTIQERPDQLVFLPKVRVHGNFALKHTNSSRTHLLAGNDRDAPKIVTVSVPLNTAVIGSLVTRRELHIPSDLTFADFYSRMCANMDLNPSEASVGYKFHTDHARDPPRELSSESDYLPMMQEMVRKVLAARTRNPVLFLHNLVRPCLLTQRVT